MGQMFSKLFGSRKKRGKQPVSTAAAPAAAAILPNKQTLPPSGVVFLPNEPILPTTGVAAPPKEAAASAYSSGRPTPNPHPVDQRIIVPHPGGRSTPDPGPSGWRTPDPRSIGQRVIPPYPGGQRALDLGPNGQSTHDPQPSGQLISDGIYIINNEYHHRFVYLEDPNGSTPLKGHFKPGNCNAQWRVRNYGNDQYSIENVEHDRYADSRNRAKVKAHVEGSSKERLWRIQALPTGEYTIATTDTANFWMLPSDIEDTPVELFNVYTDRQCWWTFKQQEIGAPANEHPTTPPVLFEQKLPLVPSDGQPTPEAAIAEFTSAITEAVDLLHPLRAACGALRAVLQKSEIIGHVNEDLKGLVKRLKFHLATVKVHIAQLEEDQEIDKTIPGLTQGVRESLESYAGELKEIPELLLVNRPNYSFIVNKPTSTTRKIDEAFQKYTTALHQFAASTVDQTRQQLAQFRQEFKEESEKTRLNRPNAYGIQHRECLQGTREKTLPAISEWFDDENTEKWIFFFLDVAGSGKSTVAKHMAEKWKRENRLLARFFFSRDTTATMSTDPFCSTVANAFALLDPEFQKHMGNFARRPDLELLPFEERFEGLVVGPLRAIGQRAILIIDALDECHPEQRDQMLETLRTQHSSIPLLRVFVTGRPERDIKRWANDKFGFGYTNFTLLEKGDTDVELYIKHRLQDLPIAQDRLYPVIRNAEGLFIWARIACDLILKTIDIDGLLEELGREVSLDYLYKVALEQSTPKEGASHRATVLVLQMILAAREPLSIAELEILSPKRGVVENVITCLSSVLLYQGREDPIRLLHATFREFLTTPSKANLFFIQPELGHHTLASGCLNTISHLSKQDNTTLRNVDRISDRNEFHFLSKRFIDSVSRTLVYSSESWGYHCSMSYRKLALNEQLLEFANGELKTWIDLMDNWQGLSTPGCLRNALLLFVVLETLLSQSLKAVRTQTCNL